MEDQLFREFLTKIMLMLEPRKEDVGTILYDQNEEVTEMFFILKGAVDIGFYIDRKAFYSMRLSKGMDVGAYQCTFDGETMFIFKVNQ